MLTRLTYDMLLHQPLEVPLPTSAAIVFGFFVLAMSALLAYGFDRQAQRWMRSLPMVLQSSRRLMAEIK
jgi:hypothetical protein